MTETHSIAKTLNHLIEIAKDGQEGFRDASENVENPELKQLFSRYSLQRSSFAGELQALVISLGEEEEKEGGLLAAAHRGWMDIKGKLTKGDDHAILAECERGEDHAKAAYADVLEDEDLPANIRQVVAAQYAEVKLAHDDVRDRRDALAD